MTAGSTLGAWLTYWIGRKAGEKELPRFVCERHIERLERRVKNAGAATLAVAAALPPPFPLTPFVLTCGALEINRTRFLTLVAMMRVIRFGIEASLARIYGTRMLRFFRSDIFETVVVVLIVAAVAGTVVSGIMLWRRTRVPARRSSSSD